MDLKLLNRLMGMFEKSTISAMEVESGDFRVKMEKQGSQTVQQIITHTPQGQNTVTQSNHAEDIAVNETEDSVNDVWEYSGEIKSPMVGVFRSLKSLGKDEDIEIGSKINIGDVVCVIEAMKLMNDIESDVEGEVAQIMANDGDMVEYGQTLFRIK